MPTDTHPDMEKAHLEILAKAPVSGRMGLALSLSRTVIGLSRRAIARAHPGAGEREQDLLFVEYHYGRRLAEDVRKYLVRTA